MATAICDDGTRFQPIVFTQQKRLSDTFERDHNLDLKIVPWGKFPAECKDMVLKSLDWWMGGRQREGQLRAGDHVVWDQHAVHSLPEVKEVLNDRGIESTVIPGSIHHFLLPNDNNFHGVVKARWRHFLRNGDPWSIVKKFVDLDRAYKLVGPGTIRKMFERTMIGHGQRCEFTESKLQKLLSEGRLGSSANSKATLKKLESLIPTYERFVTFFDSVNGACDRSQRPLALDSFELDGEYWTTYARPPDIVPH